MNFREYCKEIMKREGGVRPFFAAINAEARWGKPFEYEEDLGRIVFDTNQSGEGNEYMNACLADFFSKVGQYAEICSSPYEEDMVIISLIDNKICKAVMSRKDWSQFIGSVNPSLAEERLYHHYVLKDDQESTENERLPAHPGSD